MTDGLKDEHREAIIAAIAANDRVERAVLFGSRATGTNTVSSDVDIALFGDRLTLTDQARLAAALDEIPMAQSLDLLLYDSIQDRTLREHIRRNGIDWYARPDLVHEVPLRSLCEAIVDCPHSTPTWTPDGVVVLRSKNIRDGRLDLSEPSYTSERDYAQRTKRATPRTGDLVITREAPMGEVCMIPDGLRCCLGQRMVLLRPRSATTDPRYLLYALQSNPVQQSILLHEGTGSTVSNLRIPLLENLPIPNHALPEQRAIAHVLGTLDDKIELNRRMNTTLEAMARALFESWFIDFDPVRAKMEGRDTKLPKHIADLFPISLSESRLGTIPRGWTIYRLDEIADHHTKSTTPSAFPESQFEHYSIPAYDTGQTPAIEPGVAIKSNKIIVPRDAVLLSKLNPENGRVWATRNPHHLMQVCSTEFLVFTPREPANRALLYFLFVDERFRMMMKSMVTGTSKSHQRVPPRALRESNVVCGTAELFEMFHQMIGSILSDMIARRAESFTLAAVRDALVPRLISGEVPMSGSEMISGSVT